ncbi:MAG TPA: acyl carrier protein [Pirellula sp.]|nr:acyl carrier protein [Pirellula sp.]
MAIKDVKKLQSNPPPTLSVVEIQQWMIQHLAHELQVDPEKIAIGQPILSCGIDSMQVVTFVAKLEDLLGVRFSTNPLEDHSTIKALSQHVADMLGTRQ